MIDSVRMSDNYPDVIEVTDQNGARWTYHLRDGVLWPGRPYVTTSDVPPLQPGDGKTCRHHRVHLFLPYPDGQPYLLKVECRPAEDA